MELPVEEWNLLPFVYKNAVNNRRAAWRVITSVEQKETSKGEEQLVSNAREYVEKVEGELQKIRDGILALMDKKLVPSVNTDETKVFYYKMKSDYYRHLAEFATGETKSKAGESACVAYTEATEIAEKDLAVTALIMDVITRLQAESLPQMQFIDKVVDVAVAAQRQIPIVVRTIQKTTDIPQLQCIDKVVDDPVVEEPAEFFKASSQDRVQQRSRGQIIETPAVSLAEKIVEVPVIQAQGKTQQAMNTHVQHVVNAVEAEMPRIIKETVQRKKPILNEKINQVTKRTEIPQLQFLNEVADMPVVEQQVSMVQMAMEAPQVRVVAKTVENPQLQKTVETAEIQIVRDTQTSESLSMVPEHQPAQTETVEVDKIAAPLPTESASPMFVSTPVMEASPVAVECAHAITYAHANPVVEYVTPAPTVAHRASPATYTVQEASFTNARDTGRTAGAQVSTSVVQRLKAKFEAKQKGPQYPQSAPERATIQSVQKTVEVPRVQYIDKVADIPVDVQRQVSTIHTAQQDTQHENKKRKAIFVNIASGDEAEDESEKEPVMAQCLVQGGESMLMDETDAQGPEHEMVQTMHAEWVQELRDVKNELMHVRELVGVLVRRERSAKNKAEVAARRLDRMEREQTEADEAEHEANLQEALSPERRNRLHPR